MAMVAEQKTCDVCGCGHAQTFQLKCLDEDVREVKERVQRLETTLARGMMLLVANLAAVCMSLAQQLIRS